MNDLRCRSCKHKLAECNLETQGIVEIKCKLCKAITRFVLTGQPKIDTMVLLKQY